MERNGPVLVDAVRTEGRDQAKLDRDLSIRSRESNSIGEEDFSDYDCLRFEIFTIWDICVMRCDFCACFLIVFLGVSECFVIFFEVTR